MQEVIGSIPISSTSLRRLRRLRRGKPARLRNDGVWHGWGQTDRRPPAARSIHEHDRLGYKAQHLLNHASSLYSKEIKLPLTYSEPSQKSAKGIHLQDLAEYLDKRREVALSEVKAFR